MPETKPRCPVCESTEIRHRIRTDDFWCRHCGWQGSEWKKPFAVTRGHDENLA